MKEWPIVLKKLNGTIVVNTEGSRVCYPSKTLTKKHLGSKDILVNKEKVLT